MTPRSSGSGPSSKRWTGIDRAASITRVRAIETRRRLRGALDGLLIGSSIGVPLFAVTTAVGVVREGNGGTIVPNWLGYATAGASAAAIVAYGGALIGPIRGRTVRYEIQSAPPGGAALGELITPLECIVRLGDLGEGGDGAVELLARVGGHDRSGPLSLRSRRHVTSSCAKGAAVSYTLIFVRFGSRT